MKQLIRKVFLVASFSAAVHFAPAQEGHVAAGGDASGSGGTVSYSYGQSIYATATDNTVTITQGIQQPYEISVVSDVSRIFKITSDLIVYPNPTQNELTLNLSGAILEGMEYLLCDVTGKLLESKTAVTGKTTISLVNYNKGIYFLKLTSTAGEVKTYKIIKN